MSESRLGTLKELVDLVSAKALPVSGDTELRCINLEDIPEGAGRIVSWTQASDNLSMKTQFQTGDVLFGKLRPYLRKFALAGFDGVCTTEILAFRPKSGIDRNFVFQVVSSDAFIEHNVAVSYGTKMPRTDWATAASFPVLIPSQVEQRGIAEVLSALDAQIEATEALIEKLTQRRKGLVQEHLLPAAVTASTVALGDACSVITSGSRGWAQYYAPEGDLFLRIGNLTRAHPNLRFEDVVLVKPPSGGEGQRTRLEAGDVLISITADLGIIGCVPESLGTAYINQHIALARINDPELDPRWVSHVLASSFGLDQISKLNDGGAKAGLNLPTIKALRVPKPLPETQKELAAMLDAADKEIAAEQELAEKLRRQKQGLMRDLLTGAVRVTEAN